MKPTQIFEVIPSTTNVVTVKGTFAVRSNVVIIQNAGTTLVTLDDGWDLRPGEKISFGNYELNVIIRHTFRVSFGSTSLISGEDPEDKVQVYEMKVGNIHSLADYIDQ